MKDLYKYYKGYDEYIRHKQIDRDEIEYHLVPIIEELTAYNVYEHQPLNYYRYGEYPRFQMPIANRCRYKTIKRKKDDK